MNNHFLNSSVTKIISLLGYIIGFLIFLSSVVFLFVDFNNWFQYTVTGSLGLGIFMISNITIAHYENTELILRIIKRQEELFKESKMQSYRDPMDIISQISPISIRKVEDVAKIIKDSMEESLKENPPEKQPSNLDKLNLKELKELKDEHIASEDYEKVNRINEEIKKRQQKNDDEKNNDTSL